MILRAGKYFYGNWNMSLYFPSRQVLKSEGEDFAKKNGMMFVETSTRDSVSVTEVNRQIN